MKHQKTLLILFMACIATAPVFAAPTSETNIALDINRSTFSTFSNTGGLFDGLIDSNEKFSAESGDISKFIQQVIVPLKDPAYLRELKVYWDVTANAEEYQLQYSQDGRKWFNLNRSRSTRDKTSVVHTFDGAGRSAKGIRIQIPTDKTKPGVKYRLQELQIFPNMETRNTIRAVTVPVLSDTEALVQINGTLDGDKFVDLLPAEGTNPKVIPFRSLDSNEAVLVGLEPGKSYFYTAKMQDFNRNQAQSDRGTLRAERTNLALNKKITGTFGVNPGDNGYKGGDNLISRITDGGYDYFSQSATSGSIYDNDQFFVIDLGVISPVRKVTLYWRALSYPNQYQIQVSNDNQTWRTVKDKINANQAVPCMLPGSGQLSPAMVQQIELANVSGRYIKILIPKDSPFTSVHSNWEFVQLFEAKVF